MFVVLHFKRTCGITKSMLIAEQRACAKDHNAHDQHAHKMIFAEKTSKQALKVKK
jgi:hypothetical protein